MGGCTRLRPVAFASCDCPSALLTTLGDLEGGATSGGDADAEGHDGQLRQAAVGDASCLHGSPQTLRHDACPVAVGPGQQDDELIAAEPEDLVVTPALGLEHLERPR